MTTAAQALVDGQNVDKSLLRALLADLQAGLSGTQGTVANLVGDSQNHHNDIVSLQTQITSHTAALASLTTTAATLQSEIDARTATLDALSQSTAANFAVHQGEIVVLQASTATLPGLTARLATLETAVAAAQAAFVSLSAIITAQEVSGMGPIVPVLYPGLNVSGAAWANDNPFGAGKSLSAGYGEPYASPVTGATFAVSARVKTGGGAAQIAVGQHELFSMGCDAAGHATARFGSAGPAGGAPTAYATITSSVAIADNAWHTLELDLTDAGAILFVDGEAAGTSDVVAHFYGAHPFGVRGLGGNRALTPWMGEIAEVAVWTAAKHMTRYTLNTAPYTGAEGMAVLYHLAGDGKDALAPNPLPIGMRPPIASGVRFFLEAGDSVTYTVQPTGSGPDVLAANLVTITGPLNGDWYEPFTANLMLFVAGVSGAPVFRWLALPVIGQGGMDPSNLAGTSTTTPDATPTVIQTILLTQPGIAADISGHVLARNTVTGDAMSFSVSAVVRQIDTANAAIDQVSITAFSPPASMAACTLTLGVFGSTITLTAKGLSGAAVAWRPQLQTTVI